MLKTQLSKSNDCIKMFWLVALVKKGQMCIENALSKQFLHTFCVLAVALHTMSLDFSADFLKLLLCFVMVGVS